MPVGGAGLGRAQRLAPLVEDLAQGESALDRGLDVDDAVGGVRVQPVQAGPARDEGAVGGGLGLRSGDADARGDLAGRAVHEDGQVGVDMEESLLGCLAADPVHGAAGGPGGRAGQRRGSRNRHALGSEGAGGWRRLERAQRAQRGQREFRRPPWASAVPGDRQRDADSRSDHDHRCADPGHPVTAPPAPRLQSPHLGDLRLSSSLPVPACLGHPTLSLINGPCRGALSAARN